MNKLKILLGRGSPRSNIPKVEYQNQFLPCDKIIPRYITEWKAYQHMRNFFLNHKEYSHLVMATDDIIVQPWQIELLIHDIKEFDFPVISGVMNVEQNDKEELNICYKIAAKKRSLRLYEWIKRSELPDVDIFQVQFSGFPLMAISRKIVERNRFMADKIFQGQGVSHGASLDLVFCWWCIENKIPVYVDQRIMLNHRRSSGTMQTNLDDKLYFWPEGKDPVQIKL